jgi:CheY-like chemotaxis protein
MFMDLLQACPCHNSIYKLIIMDIQMPIMDGIKSSEEILKVLKQLKRESESTIIALTSYTSEAVVKKCE